jgi:hypothetical protein
MTSMVRELAVIDPPYIRYKILVNALGKDPQSRQVQIVRDEVSDCVLAKTLLAEQRSNGQIPLDVYDKWRGVHWVLADLADLGYAAGNPKLIPLREQLYDWLFSDERQKAICDRTINGRVHWHASQEGNALFSLLSLGLQDKRTDELARLLIKWQWPDGGWNCDLKAKGHTSSFTETLTPLRGLTLHARLTGSSESAQAAERAAEVFLCRHLFKRQRDGKPIKAEFTDLHYPCYWHYDILFDLKVMMEAGFIQDERCADALDLLNSKQLMDGSYPAERKYYQVGRTGKSGDTLVN